MQYTSEPVMQLVLAHSLAESLRTPSFSASVLQGGGHIWEQNTILETVLSAANAAQIYCPSVRCDDRPVRETWAGFLSQANRAQGLTSGKCIAG